MGLSSEVKTKAGRAERAWEAATGLAGAVAATGTAAIAAGIAIPPLAPFLGLVAAGSFYFKLRAKWAKEDPPRTDFGVATEYQPTRLDLMPVTAGVIPSGAGVPALLFAAGASVEATVLCAERAAGARVAAQETNDDTIRAALADRVREAYAHARRTEMLTMSLHEECENLLLDLPPEAVQRAREAWYPGYAHRSLAEVLGERTQGRLIAAGLDERLLNFPLPRDFPLSEPDVAPGANGPTGGDEVTTALAQAGAAAEELGISLRQWAWEATIDLERP